MHFAAYAYVGESVEKPARYDHNNRSAKICVHLRINDLTRHFVAFVVRQRIGLKTILC